MQDKPFLSKGAAFAIIGAILVAIIILSVVSVSFFGEDAQNKATIFVSTEGFDQNVTNRSLTVTSGDSVKEIFSLKYKKYYEQFGRPLVSGNEFVDFLGQKKNGSKRIIMYFNGEQTLDVSQCFVAEGAQIVIKYVDR